MENDGFSLFMEFVCYVYDFEFILTKNYGEFGFLKDSEFFAFEV